MSTRNTRILIAVVAVVAVVAVGLVVFGNANPAQTPAPATLTAGLISPQQYTSQFVDAQSPHQLVDVRTPEEFASGHLPNAVNIPLQELSARLDEIAQDEPIVLYCRSGNRSNQAAQLLGAEGFTQVLDLGGIQAWEAAGLPVVQ